MDRQLIYQSAKRKKSTIAILSIIGVFIMVINFTLHEYFKSTIGFILIILPFYRKEIYISEKNIEFVHKALSFRHTDILPISKITDIVIKNNKETTIICLISNYGLKKIVTDKYNSNIVIQHLTQVNKKLKVS